MEIRRFGVGNRRPDGPPGTVGVRGQVIHADARGAVAELAFARNARVEPHSSVDTTWLLILEGGGWVQVGDERARVAPGEAVLWPAGITHSAWTELTEMRALTVELTGADDAWVRGILDGRALLLPAAAGAEGSGSVARVGQPSAPVPGDPGAEAAAEGEPI